jgi:hypothetical protein
MDSSVSVKAPLRRFRASSTPTTLFLVINGTPSAVRVLRPVSLSMLPPKRGSACTFATRSGTRWLMIQPARLPSSGTASSPCFDPPLLVDTSEYS